MARSSNLWRMVGVGALCAVVSGSLVAGLIRHDTTEPVSDGSTVVARLNDDVVLRSAALQQRLATLPPDLRAALHANRPLLEQWIRERLVEAQLLDEAMQQGWAARESVAAALRAATEQVVLQDYLAHMGAAPADYPSPAQLAQAYQQAADQLIAPARYHLQQIFIAETADNPAQPRSEALAGQARTANDFAALAKAESDSPDVDTGWVVLSQLLPAVREQVLAMSPGDIAGPIQSEAGWHILHLVAEQPPRQLALAEVSDLLRERLREQYRQQHIGDYVNGLLQRASLSIDGAALSQAMDAME